VSGPVYMFCAPKLIFGAIGGVWIRFYFFALPESFWVIPRTSGSHFHVLRSQTRFVRYQGRRVPFSSFSLPDTFLAVPRAHGPVFMFCAPGLVWGGIKGVGSRLHVLRS
jgi:hypothetical protein